MFLKNWSAVDPQIVAAAIVAAAVMPPADRNGRELGQVARDLLDQLEEFGLIKKIAVNSIDAGFGSIDPEPS